MQFLIRNSRGSLCAKPVYEDLARKFSDKEFLVEKKEKQQLVIGAMVKADRDRSFDLIQGALTRKSLFKKKQQLKFQKDIIQTLSGFKSVEVAELLLKLFESKKLPDDLKEQCKIAIASIRTRTV